ncbi:MAG TPA: hypothetical protein VGQ87_00940 [Patescibacteria group bacterium]|jgi:hypothetical protein|nr:hypothetical protein [Patescibacteria group bacterium]
MPRETENSEPFDVSEQFEQGNAKEFREFLRSVSGARVSISVDITKAPRPDELRDLISYTAEQIASFTIRATKKQRQDNLEYFMIPGVKWEEIQE